MKTFIAILLASLQLFCVFADPFACADCVFLDPGHGGYDPGCVYSDLMEKDINLRVSLLVKQYLEDKGIKVVMTRETDQFVSLEQRSQIANSYEQSPKSSGIFVSIHVNASDNPQPSGFEVYVSSKNAKAPFFIGNMAKSSLLSFSSYNSQELCELSYEHSQDLGNLVLNSFGKAFKNSRNRGLRTEDYYVLTQTKMPSILFELGFISNQDDRLILTGQEKAMAKAVAGGIIEYLRLNDDKRK